YFSVERALSGRGYPLHPPRNSLYLLLLRGARAPRQHETHFGRWIGACSWASYVINEIDKVRGRKRVWFIFSGRTDSGGLNHEDLSVAHLNRVRKKLQAFQSKGASVYLYDLRDEE